MNEYNIPNNINAIGVLVKTFPNGIGDAFMGLMNKLPGGKTRVYYGIAKWTPEGMKYVAAAEEKYDGEGKEFGLESYTIEKGDYLAVEISDWQPKTNTIKDVFAEMYEDERADKTKPSVEVYKNENEMLCLAKINRSKIPASDVDTPARMTRSDGNYTN